MCCFLVPMVQAIATTACRKHYEQNVNDSSAPLLLRHLPSLEKMLWGGTLMLIVDHIINGELMLSFPFFSALALEGGAMTMLREMLTVGLPAYVDSPDSSLGSRSRPEEPSCESISFHQG